MGEGHIDFIIIREEFNEYELEDGLRLKVKPIVTDIVSKGSNAGFALVFDLYSKVISSLDDALPQKDRYDGTNPQFKTLKEVVNIYEIKTAIILVVYHLKELFATAERDAEGHPIFRIDGDALVNVVERPSIGRESIGHISSRDKDVFRNIFWARLCERYLKRAVSTDFIFDIEGVRRPLQEDGLGIQAVEQPFVEIMLKEIQNQDGLLEILPDQQRFRLTGRGIEYCRLLPKTNA
jgi:hypothetical protein